MAESVKILSLSELIGLSRPINGAASLQSSSSPPVKRPRVEKTLISDAKSKLNSFTPISRPVLLIGTVNLYTDASNQFNSGCINHCFSFSDGNCTICCYIHAFVPCIVGREIHVTAWNFVPSKQGNAKGVLEILQWRFSSSDSAFNNDFSLSVEISEKPNLKARAFAFGVIKSLSLIFTVPHDNQVQNSENHNSVGFLAEILTCECETCNKNPNFDQNYDSHCFAESKVVYFVKPTHVWRNIIANLIGKLINFSGLKKKMIFVGGKESYTMLVSTVNTKFCLYESVVRNIRINSCEKKEGNFISIYKGVITGIYMNGMIIELDEKVWLLIHDLLLLPQHSLRIGAIVSVRDFHLICANFAWIKVIIIGTCVKTNININSFTISDIKLRIKIQDKSLLGKFVESLKLSARFWVLIMITCFRRKFAGILSDKDILGLKNRAGLIQIYANGYLPPNAFQSQHGIFMRFCKHDECIYSTEFKLTQLKLVVPISNFISKCEEIWISILEKINEDSEENYLYNNYFCEGISYPGFMRKIIPSEDIGCILIGNIKSCPYSGRLKLVDATGRIDIVIPDLISDFNSHTIYEIREYKLVLEGLVTQVNNSKYDFGEPLSLRAIFKHFSNKSRINNLTFYIQFYIRESISLTNNSLSQVPSNISNNINLGVFHLLFISHKFPLNKHLQFEPNLSSSFAEALILPYYFNQQEIASNLSRNCCKNSGKGSILVPCSQFSRNNDNKGTILSEFLSRFDDGTQFATRVLLEFKPDSFTKFQLLRIGAYYLINCSKNSPLSNTKDCQCIKNGKIFVNSENTLWSLCLSLNENKQDQTEFSRSSPSGLVTLKPLRELYENVDFHLKLDGFTKFLPPLNQVLSVSSYVQLMRGQNANFHNLPNLQLGPRLALGDLISLHGIIDKFHTNASEGVCMHLLDDDHMVQICGKLNKWTCPVGMGPGAIVTFHRLLLTRLLNQRPRLMLTPTTYVEILSIREFSNNKKEQNAQKMVHNSLDESSFENLRLSLFSELKLCFKDTNVAKFSCRVLAVKMLVLQQCDVVPKFKIPLAGFILDDGSATSCCWADENQANTLLRLQVISSAFFSSDLSSSQRVSKRQLTRNFSNSSEMNNKVCNHLERMLNKHQKVTVKNHGPSLEASSRTLSLHSGSGQMFSIVEERLLNFIILKASQGPIFSIIGSLMDANALKQFDTNIISEPYSLRRCLKNIWVREVIFLDPLKEALNMLHDLTTR